MEKVSLWNIFFVFAKIGAFTIGGGYTMVPAIEAEMRRKQWLSEDELPDMVALSQSAPGLLTVNMAVFTGYRLRGLAGSVAATVGCLLPPFAIILLIAMFFSDIRDYPLVAAIFNGVRPAAVAIIAAYTAKLVKSNRNYLMAIPVSLTVALLVLFMKISPIYILLVLIIGTAAISYFRQKGK